MLIGALPINTFGCGMYRVIIPLRNLEERYPAEYKSHICMTKHLNGVTDEEFELLGRFTSDKDIIIVQRRTGSAWERLVKNWLLEGKKVIYELDDTYEGIPPHNLKLNARYMCSSETRNSLANMLRMVTAVTVSTPELKEWVGKFCDIGKVHMLKNTLDFSLWPEPHFGEKGEDDPVVVGFAGAENHHTDLAELGGSLELLSSQFNPTKETKVLFGFFGFMLEQFWRLEPHVAFSMGVKFLEYPAKLASLRYDIGLAPLKQCFFNRCKSELRYLEHAALGVPVVATDIEPFRRAITEDRGILVGNKPRKWSSAIKALINDVDRRKELGHNAYAHVRKCYNISTYLDKWNTVYKGV